jgi:hypothetical protein
MTSKKIYIKYDWNATGGKIPIIDDTDKKTKNMPIFFSDVNIYFNSQLIVDNKSDRHFKLTNAFVLESEPNPNPNTNKFEISLLNELVNETIIINPSVKIPFNICLIQNKFNIIKKLYQNMTSKYIKVIKPDLISSSEFKIINDTFKKVFILNSSTTDYINIASKPNLLHKFAFANKLRELLEILFAHDTDDTDVPDDVLSSEILKCFDSPQSYVNLSDIVEITKEYTNLSKNKTESEAALNRMGRRYEEHSSKDTNYKTLEYYLDKDIEEIKQFISFNKILKKMEANELFIGLNIGLAELFYSCYIGVRLYNPKLSIGHLSNKILPINQCNLLSNLLNKSYDEIKAITVSDKKSNIPYILFKYNGLLPNYHSYSSTLLRKRNIFFPDCVENTLLQLIKTHCWDNQTKKFNPNYLPVSSHPKLVEFISGLNIENDDTPDTKSTFGEMISDISSLSHIYKHESSYEIVSDIENFILITNYLFGLKSDKDTFSRQLFETRKNPNIDEINLNGNNIQYKVEDNKVNFFINKGHSSHSVTQSEDVKLFNKYDYINLIKFFTSNYSFISLIEFQIYRFISGLNRDKKQIVNINELLLDPNLYFLNNVIEDSSSSYNISDIIYSNKRFFDHLKLLEQQDYDDLLFKSKFIFDTLHNFGSPYLPSLPNNIHELKKEKHTKYCDYMPIILDCLGRNPVFLSKPDLFPQEIGSTNIELSYHNSKRNLLFALITNYYYRDYNPSEIDKIKKFILDPIFKIIKGNNSIIYNIFLTQSINCNTLYDLIHDPKIVKDFGDYFNDKYDNTLFRCIKIKEFFDVTKINMLSF